MYYILPETEGRTLEEIELHYSDDSKGITDTFIPKKAKANNFTWKSIYIYQNVIKIFVKYRYKKL